MSQLRYFPIFLDLTKFRILVVGGGRIGSKRALKISKYCNNVTVYSLEFTQELQQSKVNLIKGDAKNIDEDFLRNYDIIFVATNDKLINNEICSKAIKLGKLCNNPTNPDISQFIMPIFYSDNDIEIAVTTYGKSSLVSKMILDKIISNIADDAAIKASINIMYDIKNYLKKKINDPLLRYKLYHEIFNDNDFEILIKDNKITEAKKRAEEIIDEYVRK